MAPSMNPGHAFVLGAAWGILGTATVAALLLRERRWG